MGYNLDYFSASPGRCGCTKQTDPNCACDTSHERSGVDGAVNVNFILDSGNVDSRMRYNNEPYFEQTPVIRPYAPNPYVINPTVLQPSLVQPMMTNDKTIMYDRENVPYNVVLQPPQSPQPKPPQQPPVIVQPQPQQPKQSIGARLMSLFNKTTNVLIPTGEQIAVKKVEYFYPEFP